MALEGFRIYSETADDVLPFGPATDVVLADGTTGAVPTAGFATDAELAAHEADTTNIHGIADTSLLATLAIAHAEIMRRGVFSGPF